MEELGCCCIVGGRVDLARFVGSLFRSLCLKFCAGFACMVCMIFSCDCLLYTYTLLSLYSVFLSNLHLHVLSIRFICRGNYLLSFLVTFPFGIGLLILQMPHVCSRALSQFIISSCDSMSSEAKLNAMRKCKYIPPKTCSFTASLTDELNNWQSGCWRD